MDLLELFIFFSLGLIELGTIYLARSKGQNPWLWGGASILLMMVPGLQFLGIVPMVFLLFFRRAPQAPAEIAEDRVICPKCQAYHATGHNFCVNCGWQLDQPYAPEDATTGAPASEASASGAPAKEAPPAAAATLASEQEADAVSAVQDEAVADAPVPVVASEQVTEAGLVEESSVEQLPLEPVPAEPTPKPAFRFALTAAGLTERGVSLFTQGRIQEAVDQFTKAIALDPDYRPAWTKRAEAYLRLGLSQKAEEDQRRLEGI